MKHSYFISQLMVNTKISNTLLYYLQKSVQMSDSQEQSFKEENQKEYQDEENQEEEQQQDEDESNENQDSNQQDQQGDEDEDYEEQQAQNEEQEKQPEVLPKFRAIDTKYFKFSRLLSQISNLSVNVDKFIETLPSQGGYIYKSYFIPPKNFYSSSSLSPSHIPQQQKKPIKKDQNIQVSMQPQIGNQSTKVIKAPFSSQPTDKLYNQRNSFLAQLYQQNRNVKRCQTSSNRIGSFTQSQSVGNVQGSQQRFQRQNYQKGFY